MRFGTLFVLAISILASCQAVQNKQSTAPEIVNKNTENEALDPGPFLLADASMSDLEVAVKRYLHNASTQCAPSDGEEVKILATYLDALSIPIRSDKTLALASNPNDPMGDKATSDPRRLLPFFSEELKSRKVPTVIQRSRTDMWERYFGFYRSGEKAPVWHSLVESAMAQIPPERQAEWRLSVPDDHWNFTRQIFGSFTLNSWEAELVELRANPQVKYIAFPYFMNSHAALLIINKDTQKFEFYESNGAWGIGDAEMDRSRLEYERIQKVFGGFIEDNIIKHPSQAEGTCVSHSVKYLYQRAVEGKTATEIRSSFLDTGKAIAVSSGLRDSDILKDRRKFIVPFLLGEQPELDTAEARSFWRQKFAGPTSEYAGSAKVGELRAMSQGEWEAQYLQFLVDAKDSGNLPNVNSIDRQDAMERKAQTETGKLVQIANLSSHQRAAFQTMVAEDFVAIDSVRSELKAAIFGPEWTPTHENFAIQRANELFDGFLLEEDLAALKRRIGIMSTHLRPAPQKAGILSSMKTIFQSQPKALSTEEQSSRTATAETIEQSLASFEQRIESEQVENLLKKYRELIKPYRETAFQFASLIDKARVSHVYSTWGLFSFSEPIAAQRVLQMTDSFAKSYMIFHKNPQGTYAILEQVISTKAFQDRAAVMRNKEAHDVFLLARDEKLKSPKSYLDQRKVGGGAAIAAVLVAGAIVAAVVESGEPSKSLGLSQSLISQGECIKGHLAELDQDLTQLADSNQWRILERLRNGDISWEDWAKQP